MRWVSFPKRWTLRMQSDPEMHPPEKIYPTGPRHGIRRGTWRWYAR